VQQTGINYLLCVFSFGDLPAEDAMQSLDLFSKDILPNLKA